MSPAVYLHKLISVSYLFDSPRGRSACYNLKGDNLAWQVSSKDSSTMNFGNSTASFSELYSDFIVLLLFFLSYKLCLFFAGSVLHHEVQLNLRIYQDGKPFALVETGIYNQYTRTGSRISSLFQLQVFNRQ